MSRPVLALDTSAGGCSAALLAGDGQVLAARAERLERGHSERLMPMIAEVLAEAGVPAAGLGLVAATTGPGAFTGIRIGIAAARGLALAAGIPACGISSFDVHAAAVPPALRTGRDLLVAIDSRRDDVVFLRRYPGTGEPAEPVAAATSAADLAAAVAPRSGGGPPLLLAGDATPIAARLLAEAGIGAETALPPGPPDAPTLARLALARLAAGAALPPARPLYLRAPDVTQAKAP